MMITQVIGRGNIDTLDEHGVASIQGCLPHKKLRPPGTLQ